MSLDPEITRRLARIAAGEEGAVMAEPVPGYSPPDCTATDDRIAGVPVRRYGPDGAPATLVWVHGGGFSAGDLDMPESDTVARELVHRAGVAVVSVDYRLAAFPAGLEDVVAVVSSLGTPRDSPLVLGGTSAGGNLALATALRLRDHASIPLAGLILAYPYLHAAHPAPPPGLAARMAVMPEAVRFGDDTMRAMASFYLGALAERPPRSAYPGTDADYAGLPPTLVIGAEYDDLLSSAVAAAAGLRAAGVEVEEHLEPGVLHGHLNTPGLPGALRTLDTTARFIRALLV